MNTFLDKPILDKYGLSRFVLRFSPFLDIDDEKFYEFSQANRDVQMERSSNGEVIVMAPTGWQTGDRNSEINFQLRRWTKESGSGHCADSSTGYLLPNGAIFSPDASWISNEHLEKIPESGRRRFLPLTPDFVIELRSESDQLISLQDKMAEYIENGASLGWLIDPIERKVHVYRHGRVETLDAPKEASGEPFLKGFVLDLTHIWD